MRYGLILILAASLHAATVVRMACGGPGGTDTAGNVWAADSGVGGGLAWTATSQPNLASQPVPYQSMCYSVGVASFSRTFSVPSGDYTVKFKFLEPNKTGAGQRIFGASINGVPVISGLDLFAAAGALKPYDLAFNTTAVNGSIQIIFTTAVWKSVISAIQIDSVATIPPPTLFVCSGQASTNQNCNGLLWAKFAFPDGTVSMIGATGTPPNDPTMSWIPVTQYAQTVAPHSPAATNTQAVIVYNAPDANPCTVEVSESPTMKPLVHDTDPALFAAAGISTGGAGPRFFLSASEYSKKASTVTFIRLHCKPVSSTSSASLAAHR